MPFSTDISALILAYFLDDNEDGMKLYDHNPDVARTAIKYILDAQSLPSDADAKIFLSMKGTLVEKFIYSAGHGSLFLVKYFLTRGGDNLRCIKALDQAIMHHHLPIVELITNEKAHLKELALDGAILYGNLPIVEMLYNQGIVLNGSALVKASQYNHPHIVEFLLDMQVNPDVGDGAALRWACINGNLSIVKTLYSVGADIHHMTLIEASVNNQPEIVNFLIKQGENARINEALQLSVGSGLRNIIELLLDWRADINADDGMPLYMAIKNGNLPIVKLLLDRGAEIHDNDILREAIREGHYRIVKLLRSRGA